MGTVDYFKREDHRDFSYPVHLHRCYELIIVTDGEMTVSVAGNEHTLTRGKAIFIFPHQLHSLISEHSNCIVFIFSQKLINSFSTKYSSKIPVTPVFLLSEGLYERAIAVRADESHISLKGFLYSIAAELEANSDFAIATQEKGGLLAKIFAFVDANFKSDCSLTTAARSLGYDHAYISRYFSHTAGISYNTYVNRVRLNHAGYLLSSSEISILSCSIECGYRSLRTFNRNFKEYYGISPAEYRAQR